MDLVKDISRLLMGLAALIFAIATLIFAIRSGSEQSELHAVAHVRGGGKISDYLYTQSADGKTLYQWLWDRKARKWKKETYSGSFGN